MVGRVQQGNVVLVDVSQKDLDYGVVVHRAELDSVFAYQSHKSQRVIWTDTSFVRWAGTPEEYAALLR